MYRDIVSVHRTLFSVDRANGPVQLGTSSLTSVDLRLSMADIKKADTDADGLDLRMAYEPTPAVTVHAVSPRHRVTRHTVPTTVTVPTSKVTQTVAPSVPAAAIAAVGSASSSHADTKAAGTSTAPPSDDTKNPAAADAAAAATGTWTITFSECVENHAGMQQIGTQAAAGFTIAELKAAHDHAVARGCICELIDLRHLVPEELRSIYPEASILIIRKGGQSLMTGDYFKLVAEIHGLVPKEDTQFFHYGKVQNKNARYNLCFADIRQEPDYENKKGRIMAFADLPFLGNLRSILPDIFGPKTTRLYAELNHYYDLMDCGIGWHGDTERRYVIGLRIGETMPLHFQWFRGEVKSGRKKHKVYGKCTSGYERDSYVARW